MPDNTEISPESAAIEVLNNPAALKQLERKGVDLLVPWVEKATQLEKVQEMHDFLASIEDVTLRREFIKKCADRTLDKTYLNSMFDQASILVPPLFLHRMVDNAEYASFAVLLLVGAIGTPEDQEYLASQVEPGFLESNLTKGLEIISMWDPELVTKEIIATVAAILNAKGSLLNVAAGTREQMRAHTPEEVTAETHQEVAEDLNPPVDIDKAA